MEPSKVVRMVHPVDVHFFDPSKHEALSLAGKALVLGASSEKFKFLSVFKWQKRKGWGVLFGEYLREFSGADEFIHLRTSIEHLESITPTRSVGLQISSFL